MFNLVDAVVPSSSMRSAKQVSCFDLRDYVAFWRVCQCVFYALLVNGFLNCLQMLFNWCCHLVATPRDLRTYHRGPPNYPF